MSIVLDKPEQIAMWVLLSRRAQIKLHLNGIPVKGLVSWCKKNIEGCENARTVKQCVVPVEYAIAAAGGPQDFSIVNVHVMEKVNNTTFLDRGIFNSMDDVEANARMVYLYSTGNLEIVYTLDTVRDANGQIYVPA